MSPDHCLKVPILLIVAASSVSVALAFSTTERCHHRFPTSSTCSRFKPCTPASRFQCTAAAPRSRSSSNVSPPCRSLAAAAKILPVACAAKPSSTNLFLSTSSGIKAQTDSENDMDSDDKPKGGLRGKLRRITGFSMTAFRATLRGITGFSLTALRASVRAATGVSVTATTRAIVGVFPLWFRYFMQPFLVLYYAPLMIIRSWVGETKTAKADQLAAHEKIVEGWKHAIEVAEASQANGYWPIHVDDEGNIITNLPPEPTDVRSQSDLNEAVLESVEAADAIENE